MIRGAGVNARRGALAVALLLAGCPQRATDIEEPTPGGGDVVDEPTGGDDVDRRAIEAAVLDSYLALSNGNDEAYAEALSRDRDVTVIGVGPDDVAYGMGLAADRIPTLPFEDIDHCTDSARSIEKPLVLSRNLDVALHGKVGERSVAWVSDEISYRVPWRCRQAIVPLRFTAVFVRNLERWDMTMAHISYGVAADELRELAASRALLTPAAIEKAFSVGPAVKVRSIVSFSLSADAAKRESVIAGGDEGIAILPAANEVYRRDGDHDARNAPWIVSTIGDAGKAELDGYRISLSQDEMVAWVAANVRVTSSIDDAPVTVILRGTFVLEKGDLESSHPGVWLVVQSHFSAPVARADLAFRVFGEEAGGSGADTALQ